MLNKAMHCTAPPSKTMLNIELLDMHITADMRCPDLSNELVIPIQCTCSCCNESLQELSVLVSGCLDVLQVVTASVACRISLMTSWELVHKEALSLRCNALCRQASLASMITSMHALDCIHKHEQVGTDQCAKKRKRLRHFCSGFAYGGQMCKTLPP